MTKVCVCVSVCEVMVCDKGVLSFCVSSACM